MAVIFRKVICINFALFGFAGVTLALTMWLTSSSSKC